MLGERSQMGVKTRTLRITTILLIAASLALPACSNTLSSISISPSVGSYLTNLQDKSSEVLLKSIQMNKGICNEQYFSPYYPTPSHTVSLGDPIIVVKGAIQNQHKENTWIDIWAEGYNETGEQVCWTLDADPHPWYHIILRLETEETSEFTMHMNYSEDISSIHVYASNYPVPPP